ncbi:MAG: CHASE2 domain-containing protein [Pseudomonadota bacterium]
MRRALVASFLSLVSLQLNAADFSSDFAVVFADATTEARFGEVPLDRVLLAKAIGLAAKGGARGVIIKFFLDHSGDPTSDQELAQAMTRVPVLLQARIDDSEPRSNALAPRFVLEGEARSTAISGTNGWIPTELFAQAASDICFVDAASGSISMIETYGGSLVKSLILCAIELASGTRASFSEEGALIVADAAVPADNLFRLSVPIVDRQPLNEVKLHDLLDGRVAASSLKDKVVILAYDGPRIGLLDSGYGTVGAHRLFVLLLRDIYQRLPK